jgi:hypothetical protein
MHSLLPGLGQLQVADMRRQYVAWVRGAVVCDVLCSASASSSGCVCAGRSFLVFTASVDWYLRTTNSDSSKCTQRRWVMASREEEPGYFQQSVLMKCVNMRHSSIQFWRSAHLS